MASTDLLFSAGANPTGSPVEIVFGDDGGGSVGTVTLRAAGRITGLRGHVPVRRLVLARATGRLSGLRGAVPVAYDVNVARPMVNVVQSAAQQARPVRAGTLARYEQARPLQAVLSALWQNAEQRSALVQVRYEGAASLQSLLRQGYQQARALAAAPVAQSFEQGQPLRNAVAQQYQQAARVGRVVLQRYEDTSRLRNTTAQQYQQAVRTAAVVLAGFRDAKQLARAVAGRYEEARKPPPGVTPRPVPPQPDPCYVPSLPADLVFEELHDPSLPLGLVFVCERHDPGPEPGKTIVIPIQKAYIVINDIKLYRLDTGAELHADSFNMSLDYQSWTWLWNASLHGDAEMHLGRDNSGDPAELAAFVNGVEFRLRLESRSRERRFGPKRWAVSGKGKASVLGASDAPKQSFSNPIERTAQQLMSDVLTVNGVPLGWTVEWGLDDWLVPAGAWAIKGSYIDAITDIAGAAGGYVQPHNTASTLLVIPRYPRASWLWSDVTPDFEIPEDAAEVEAINFIDKPEYNRVFLGGISKGVFGPFTRAGTAGNIIAPQVTHSLMTHPDVHRQRGIAELSDTGKQQRVTLTMQVLPETGVIVPGKFVRYLGDSSVMGIVRSTSINWSRPRLRQTIEIEVHG